MTAPTLTEIAKRINTHLKRFESDPKINIRDPKYQTSRFYHAGAYRTGNRVAVIYANYQGRTNLTREQALEYLAWLDAGNVGDHYVMQRAARRNAA